MIESESKILPGEVMETVVYPGSQSVDRQDRFDENISLTDLALRSRGFETIDQSVTDHNRHFGNKIPYWIAKNLIIIDSLDTDLQSKIKLFAYKIWESRPSYSLIKEFLPEGLVRLDDIKGIVEEVRMDESILGRSYELIDEAHKIIEKNLSPGGLNYYKRYKQLSEIAIKFLIDPSVEDSEKEARIIEEYDLLRKEQRNRSRREAARRRQTEKSDMIEEEKERKLQEQMSHIGNEMARIRSGRRSVSEEEKKLIRNREHWSISVIEKLYSNGLSFDEIVGATKFTRSQVEKGMTALRIDGRIEVNPKSFRKTARLTEFVIEVENLLKEGRGGINYEDYDELARKLNSTKGRIQYAIHLLILLGRIEPISRGQSAQRRELERRQKYS